MVTAFVVRSDSNISEVVSVTGYKQVLLSFGVQIKSTLKSFNLALYKVEEGVLMPRAEGKVEMTHPSLCTREPWIEASCSEDRYKLCLLHRHIHNNI